MPDLAADCYPLRKFLNEDAEWKSHEHGEAFEWILIHVKKVVKRNCPLRIICYSRKQGLGAVLQQREENSWKPIAYASRVPTDVEANNIINYLKLLAVLRSVEHFPNYVYGIEFDFVSNHKALKSVIKENNANETFSSRLKRWVDRLLPFEITSVHTPRRTLGIADYLSPHPCPFNGAVIKHEQKVDDWFTINVVNKFPKDSYEVITAKRNNQKK